MNEGRVMRARREISRAEEIAALRIIHDPNPNCVVFCTVDGQRVDRSEIQSDGSGVLFYQYHPIIPVSASLTRPGTSKDHQETPVAEIEFRRV